MGSFMFRIASIYNIDYTWCCIWHYKNILQKICIAAASNTSGQVGFECSQLSDQIWIFLRLAPKNNIVIVCVRFLCVCLDVLRSNWILFDKFSLSFNNWLHWWCGTCLCLPRWTLLFKSVGITENIWRRHTKKR